MRTLPSPSVTSSSEIPDSETRSIRVLSLRRSIRKPLSMRKVPARAIAVPGLNWTCLESAARRAGRQPVEREFERVHISLPAEAANHAFSLVGEIRVMPERFAAMYVRQMNLDERDADPRQCVPNGHAGVRVRGGID